MSFATFQLFSISHHQPTLVGICGQNKKETDAVLDPPKMVQYFTSLKFGAGYSFGRITNCNEADCQQLLPILCGGSDFIFTHLNPTEKGNSDRICWVQLLCPLRPLEFSLLSKMALANIVPKSGFIQVFVAIYFNSKHSFIRLIIINNIGLLYFIIVCSYLSSSPTMRINRRRAIIHIYEGSDVRVNL